MIKIKGKEREAICFAKVIEDEAISQIQRMCDYPLSDKIRIMPDVHAGKACTIGTTMTITDKAVPEINCPQKNNEPVNAADSKNFLLQIFIQERNNFFKRNFFHVVI